MQKIGLLTSILLLTSLIIIPHHISFADYTNSTIPEKMTASVKPTKQTAAERIKEYDMIQQEKAKIAEAKQNAFIHDDSMKRKEVFEKKKLLLLRGLQLVVFLLFLVSGLVDGIG